MYINLDKCKSGHCTNIYNLYAYAQGCVIAGIGILKPTYAFSRVVIRLFSNVVLGCILSEFEK